MWSSLKLENFKIIAYLVDKIEFWKSIARIRALQVPFGENPLSFLVSSTNDFYQKMFLHSSLKTFFQNSILSASSEVIVFFWFQAIALIMLYQLGLVPGLRLYTLKSLNSKKCSYLWHLHTEYVGTEWNSTKLVSLIQRLDQESWRDA